MMVGEMRQAEVTQTAKDKESTGHFKKKRVTKTSVYPHRTLTVYQKEHPHLSPTQVCCSLTKEFFTFIFLLRPPHHQARNKNHSSKIIGSPQTPQSYTM